MEFKLLKHLRYFEVLENESSSRGSVVSAVTCPKTPGGGSVYHSASYSTANGFLSLAERGRDVNLSIHLHILPWLKASTATSVLVLYAFITGKGKYLHSQKDCSVRI